MKPSFIQNQKDQLACHHQLKNCENYQMNEACVSIR